MNELILSFHSSTVSWPILLRSLSNCCVSLLQYDGPYLSGPHRRHSPLLLCELWHDPDQPLWAHLHTLHRSDRPRFPFQQGWTIASNVFELIVNSKYCLEGSWHLKRAVRGIHTSIFILSEFTRQKFCLQCYTAVLLILTNLILSRRAEVKLHVQRAGFKGRP